MTEETRFRWAAAGSIAVVVAFAVFLVANSGALVANSGTLVAKPGSDLVLEAGAIIAAWAFRRAARRGGTRRPGVGLLCIAAIVWATANAIWTFYGITRDYAYIALAALFSTTHGGFATGDLGVSPDRTLTGWLPSACRSVTSQQPPCCHGAQAAGRTP